jgi:hypothetical protein
MQLFWVRVVIVLLSFLAVGLIWSAATVRKRLGWTSSWGQIAWVVLASPLFACVYGMQILVYWRIAGASLFEDVIATIAVIGQAVVGLVMIFYYAIRDDRGQRTGER